MSIWSDGRIGERAIQHRTIEPFSDMKVRAGRVRDRYSEFVCPGAFGGKFLHSPRCIDDLRLEVDLRALRNDCERDAIRAGMGGIRDPGYLECHSASGQGLRQRRAVPDSVFSAPTRPIYRLRRCMGKYRDQQGIVLPRL